MNKINLYKVFMGLVLAAPVALATGCVEEEGYGYDDAELTDSGDFEDEDRAAPCTSKNASKGACKNAISKAGKGKKNWGDSFLIRRKKNGAVWGECWCDSTGDHGLKGILNKKNKKCRGGLKNSPKNNDGEVWYFNDINCGAGPANDAADEKACAGLVAQSKNGGLKKVNKNYACESAYSSKFRKAVGLNGKKIYGSLVKK